MSLYIHLYDEPASPNLQPAALTLYLENLFPFKVDLRGAFLFHFSPDIESLAHGFAQAKIRNPLKRELDFTPLPGEVDYERGRLAHHSQTFGIVYEGVRIMNLLRGIIPKEENNLSHLHIVFTNQLLATWEEGRYHLRAAIYAFPCLISTTGIVEAPAKPREFYLLKQQYLALGLSDATALLEKEFKGKILEHNDPRLSEVMKGYVVQAVFHHLYGEPFCQDKNCRLYNAHWQEEVIWAQLESPYEFCPRHLKLIEETRVSL